ncbi:MAG: aminotransferase class V-fold PLP-dependent enzyme, partial [Clostridiaceae bacterium]|nr:aminotransferase class V-fold PLP-dependent enzyme [Clostridiaceae bacterium]
PIYKAIMDYTEKNVIPFHMPGHKRGTGFPREFAENLTRLDVTEIPGMDNLHFPEGIIKKAQDLAASAFGADRTYFLVNGSSCGIHASIMAVCKPGDRIIIARDCHRSAVAGAMLAGAEPVYVDTEVDDFFGITSVLEPGKLKEKLEENTDVTAVFITRPNYYGICSDIGRIVEIVHSHGKILIVDEAHGAHLKFNKTLPPGAIQAGADICVQSAHKTLPALSQGAYLHVKSSNVDISRLEFYLRMLQTTSPSYVIMASLDIARGIMGCFGEQLLDEVIKNTEQVRCCARSSEGFTPLEEAYISRLHGHGASYKTLDKTRLVINSRKLGVTGNTVSRMLKEKYGIQVEMSDVLNIVCMATVSDKKEYFDALCKALDGLPLEFKRNERGKLSKIDSSYGDLEKCLFKYEKLKKLPPPRQGVSLRDVGKTKGRTVELKRSIGKASRDFIVPYPPGVPVVCPGEIVTGETVEYIYSLIELGGNVNGVYEKEGKYFVDIIR